LKVAFNEQAGTIGMSFKKKLGNSREKIGI
jgi:hypothetical protein